MQIAKMHVYEVRPRKDHRGVDLISNALPFGRLWYGEPNAVSNAIGYAMHRGRSHDAVIRVYDEGGNVIETHEHAGEFKKTRSASPSESGVAVTENQIADSNSKTLSAFHPLAQRTAFRCHDARRQSRSFARWNQRLKRSPNSIRLC
jgi:hypothetical protein